MHRTDAGMGRALAKIIRQLSAESRRNRGLVEVKTIREIVDHECPGLWVQVARSAAVEAGS